MKDADIVKLAAVITDRLTDRMDKKFDELRDLLLECQEKHCAPLKERLDIHEAQHSMGFTTLKLLVSVCLGALTTTATIFTLVKFIH